MVDRKPVVFMCYMGQERSKAIQRIYEDAGKRVEVFEGGTKRLNWMDRRSIRRELGNKFVYLIYNPGSGDIEYKAKERATEKLNDAGVQYNILDTAGLQIMARNLGGNLDYYLV